MPDLYSTPALFKLLFYEANYRLGFCRTGDELSWQLWKMNQLRDFAADRTLAKDLYFHKPISLDVELMQNELTAAV